MAPPFHSSTTKSSTHHRDKDYLGDGVYAEYEDGSLMLTSENGAQVLNRIVLDDQVYVNLLKYVHKIQQRGGEQ